MAIIRLPLFNDITTKKLVTGSVLPAVFMLRPVGDQDVLAIELQLLELLPGGGPQAPLQNVSPVGVAPTVAIGARDSSAIYALSSAFSVVGTQLVGLLNLNTTEMGVALTGLTKLSCNFCIVLEDSSGPKLTYQDEIWIIKSLIRIGSPTPIPGETYMTQNQMNAIFLKKINNAGDTVTFVDSTGTYGRILGVNTDGSAQDDNYTI